MTLGFFSATHTHNHTRKNLYPCLRVRVFMGTGAGLMGAHGFEGQLWVVNLVVFFF